MCGSSALPSKGRGGSSMAIAATSLGLSRLNGRRESVATDRDIPGAAAAKVAHGSIQKKTGPRGPVQIFPSVLLLRLTREQSCVRRLRELMHRRHAVQHRNRE